MIYRNSNQNISDFPTNLVSNQSDASYPERIDRQSYVSEENSDETQPLSLEEVEDLASAPGQVLNRYSDERVSAEEKVISMENATVSEFESDLQEPTADIEMEAKREENSPFDNFAPQSISPDEIFSPEEIPSENFCRRRGNFA